MRELDAGERRRSRNRNLLTTTAGLRWFLGGGDGADQIADEILEYEGAAEVLRELEMRYPLLRRVIDGIEQAGRLAAGLRVAREANGPEPLVAALEERLGRERAEIGRLMERVDSTEPARLLAAYAHVAEVASATRQA